MGAIVEAELDPMIDILKDIGQDERATQGEEGNTGDDGVPLSQVPSIDSLLGEIYKLRFQLAYANSIQYKYREEKDHYRQERDESRVKVQYIEVQQKR